MHTLAEILISLPVEKSFYYRVPPRLEKTIALGARVVVPFGAQKTIGYVSGFPATPTAHPLKNIIRVLDETPCIDETMLRLSRYMARRYRYPQGKLVEHMLPALLKRKRSFSVPSYEADGAARELAVPHSETPLEVLPVDMAQDCFQERFIYGFLVRERLALYRSLAIHAARLRRSAVFIFPDAESADNFYRVIAPDVAATALYGKLSLTQRLACWNAARHATYSIVVGTRSALFLPVRRVKIIALDSVHHFPRIAEEPFKFDAYTVARYYAQLTKACLVACDIAPAASVYEKKKPYMTFDGVYKEPANAFTVVDMKEELEMLKRRKLFSRLLTSAIERGLREHKKIVLVCARKAFATLIICPTCRFVVRCPRCESAMNYVQEVRAIRCPHCHFRAPYPELCPQCKSSYLRYAGRGAQKIESELSKFFPSARIARYDAGRAQPAIQEIDIAVVTRAMLRHLPPRSFDVVGIVDFDYYMPMLNFRLMEELLHVVLTARRLHAGGEGGKTFIIQSVHKENYLFECFGKSALAKDALESFFEKELRFRKDTLLPPYAHLVTIKIRGKDKKYTEKKSLEFYRTLTKHLGTARTLEVFEPFSYTHKENNKFVAALVVKAARFSVLHNFLESHKKYFHNTPRTSIIIESDIETLG